MGNEGGTWAQYQKLVLKLLEQHEEKLDDVSLQLLANSKPVDQLTILLQEAKVDIELLKNIISEGTQQKLPLVDRVASIENQLKLIAQTDTEKVATNKEIKGYKISIIAAIICTTSSLIWELIHHFWLH